MTFHPEKLQWLKYLWLKTYNLSEVFQYLFISSSLQYWWTNCAHTCDYCYFLLINLAKQTAMAILDNRFINVIHIKDNHEHALLCLIMKVYVWKMVGNVCLRNNIDWKCKDWKKWQSPLSFLYYRFSSVVHGLNQLEIWEIMLTFTHSNVDSFHTTASDCKSLYILC